MSDEEAPEETTAGAGTRRRRGPGFASGVLFGMLAGAGLATLLTPLSGREARQRAAEKAPELWARRDEIAHDTSETVRSRLHEALDAGKRAAHEAEEKSRHRFEELSGG